MDTESNSLYAYQEQVCLIQVSTPRRRFLIDPLPHQRSLTVGTALSNPATETIFHASEYDLICLTRDFAYQFSNLLTPCRRRASSDAPASACGSLMESEFGITLDERYQRANSGRRPLRPAMLAYARLDSRS